jgi:hypothetical protein
MRSGIEESSASAGSKSSAPKVGCGAAMAFSMSRRTSGSGVCGNVAVVGVSEVACTAFTGAGLEETVPASHFS